MIKRLEQVKQFEKGDPALCSADILARDPMSVATRPGRVPICAINTRVEAHRYNEDRTRTKPRNVNDTLIDLVDPVWLHFDPFLMTYPMGPTPQNKPSIQRDGYASAIETD